MSVETNSITTPNRTPPSNHLILLAVLRHNLLLKQSGLQNETLESITICKSLLRRVGKNIKDIFGRSSHSDLQDEVDPSSLICVEYVPVLVTRKALPADHFLQYPEPTNLDTSEALQKVAGASHACVTFRCIPGNSVINV